MGTNLYVHVNECSCCGRYDRLHVGKSGTTVQAYIRRFDDDPDPTPVGEIRSWADWKRLLATVPHTAWNEYGDALSDNDLIVWFESKASDARRRQHDWIHSHYTDSDTLDAYWLDADGFTIATGDWS